MTETSETHAPALDLREATRHVMVDFNQMQAFSANPLIMVAGEGLRLTDHEGRSYIDGLSGVFAVSLGHGNEEIVDAIAAQHRRLSFSSPIMTTTDRAARSLRGRPWPRRQRRDLHPHDRRRHGAGAPGPRAHG